MTGIIATAGSTVVILGAMWRGARFVRKVADDHEYLLIAAHDHEVRISVLEEQRRRKAAA